ncbi:hypothetical protein [Pseudolactococcus hodotermopsidis]|nr:hypothetical protein [Lactococcus hodotermopsidis]
MEVRYEYPISCWQHPFDISSDLDYYIDASGFTYSGEKSDFDNPISNLTLRQKIPMGYKTLILLRRYFILDKTGIIWKNSQTIGYGGSTESEVYD